METNWDSTTLVWVDKRGWTTRRMDAPNKCDGKLFYIPGCVYDDSDGYRVLIVENFGFTDEGHELCVILDARGVSLCGFFPEWRELVV